MDKGNFKQKKNIGILICGHGSRNKLAIDEFEDLTLSVKNRYAGIHVEYGFLEFAKPSLNEALDKLKAKDIKKIIAIPAMLFAAGHVKNDIPSVLTSYAEKVDIEIRKFVDRGYERAKKVLTEKIEDLHKLAKALLTYETLSGSEIEDLINKNVYPTNKEDLKVEEDKESSALGSIGLKPKIVH